MKFTAKDYSIIKTKIYIKDENLFFFFNGLNRNSNDWIIIEQKLKKVNFSYYKILNKTSKKTLQNSIYTNGSPLLNSITFLLKPLSTKKELAKQILLQNFEPMLFTLLALKLNNKIYSKKQLESIFSFNYNDNKLLLFQFGLINLKFPLKN